MAEGLFRAALERRRCSDVEVASAGTWAYAGSAPTPEAAKVAADYGADISSHQSRPLTRAEVGEADLVVAMTSVHLKEISDVAPDARDKVFLLKELAEIQPPPSLGGGVEALRRGQRPSWRHALDLDDPIGLPLGAYQRCGRQIHSGTELLANVLCGPPPPP
jgi:protein-tyrosine-phosphatase